MTEGDWGRKGGGSGRESALCGAWETWDIVVTLVLEDEGGRRGPDE